ncbi:MAG: glycosyltransferase [Clostridiales bacterium]|nr:glycosyltransferase [Clostridiales bacterium]
MTGQDIMVSVVMIAYNNEATLRDAIAGVVGQRVPFRVELLVSDDASTDGSRAIIEEYARRYPDVVRPLWHETNVGIQGNYLSVFPHCRGRYMAMCDGDDYWCSRHKLARQVAYMERHPECAVTFHRVVNLYLPSGEKSLSGRPPRRDMSVEDLARGNWITNMSVMYRRELVDLTNLPAWTADVKLLDYAMHMFYAAHGYIHFMDRPMGVYRQWASGTWSRTTATRRLEMALSVREHLIEWFAGCPAVIANLQQAADNIKAAIADAESGKPVPTASHRLLTPLRKLLSRLLPAPSPPGIVSLQVEQDREPLREAPCPNRLRSRLGP